MPLFGRPHAALVAAAWGVIQVWDGPDQPARAWRQKRVETAEAR